MPIEERDPVFSEMLAFILARLGEKTPRTCIIIHGRIGAGKTHTAALLAAALEEDGILVGGLLSPRIMERDETVGYTVRDLMLGEERPFAGLTPPGIAIGRFYIREEGLAFARRAIERAAVHAPARAQVVFVDEVGRLELTTDHTPQGYTPVDHTPAGHAPAVRVLLRSPALPVLLIRSAFVSQVIEAFGITDYRLFSVEAGAPAFSPGGGMLQ